MNIYLWIQEILTEQELIVDSTEQSISRWTKLFVYKFIVNPLIGL